MRRRTLLGAASALPALPALSVLGPLALLLAPRSGHPGEIIRFDTTGRPRSDVVLAQVPVKAVVAEFLDPGDTGVGKSLGFLVWREILTAISDQAGAGVILARAPGGERLTDLLQTAYHDAALAIARQQSAAMAVWGAVEADGAQLLVSSYLSLLPEASGLQFKLRLVGEPPLPAGLEAEFQRTNFNFPPVETTRAALFERRVVTRTSTSLRARAEAAAPVLARIPTNSALDALDMDGGWFRVRLADGREGWIEHAQVDLPPHTVEAAGTLLPLAGAPGGAVAQRLRLDGRQRVLDMRYVARKGLFYRLDRPGPARWVAAHLVRARFSLPVVHFVAGLYRFQFKRYDDARREFAQYVAARESAADNASLATAYQFLGASTLLARPTVFETDPAAIDWFSRAVAATPYDANAYALRALSTLAVKRSAAPALEDLQQALKLDPTDRAAARITGVLSQQIGRSGGTTLQRMLLDSGDPVLQRRIQETLERYPAARPMPAASR